MEDEALSDPYLASDLPRRGSVEALRREQLESRLQDLLSARCCLPLSYRGRPFGRCVAFPHPTAPFRIRTLSGCSLSIHSVYAARGLLSTSLVLRRGR